MSRFPQHGWIRRGALTAFLLGLGATRPASAWDPSTIHVPLTERAALQSELQVRWMNASRGGFGLFSSVRLDPALLTVNEQVTIFETLRTLPDSAGARPLGGPGACPPPGSPEETQQFCVKGDLWELDALGWLRLGVLAESSPPSLVSRHFMYPDATADGVAGPESLGRNPSAAVSRSSQRRRDPSMTQGFIGISTTNETANALAWYADQEAALSPQNLARHLELSTTARTSVERQHHLAMVLLCAGALSHVLQDLALPAHARGDVDAFFLPLSSVPGDRGLPIQEWSRTRIGRAGVYQLPQSQRTPTDNLSLHELLFDPQRGVAAMAGAHNLSESTLPAPMVLSESLSTSAAAAQMLQGVHLAPEERDGAKLTAWPAESGYLRGGTGRLLSAWRRDADGAVISFLDEDLFRAQASSLLPRAMSATTRALELLFPVWPGVEDSIERGILSFQLPAGLTDIRVAVAAQDEFGDRGPAQVISLRNSGPQRLVGLPIPSLTHDTSVTFIGSRPDGSRYVTSRVYEQKSAPVVKP